MTMEATPFGMPSRKFAMWLFIIADAATFAAVLFAYGYVRFASPNWTRPFEFWPTIANGLLMTVVLLTSSFTMVAATVAARDGKDGKAGKPETAPVGPVGSIASGAAATPSSETKQDSKPQFANVTTPRRFSFF